MASACILGVIISKLGYWQELCLIILLEIDKCLEVDFHCTILIFGLAVSLKMKESGKAAFDPEEIIKQWPELQDEKRVSISHN